jgi:glycosyltransferase involved in cell wall biosynthesis
MFEGFGIPVLDALCFNLPILTSKGTSMGEIAEDAANYFSALDVDSITNTINGIFSETNRRILLSHIPSRQKQFSPDKVASQLFQNYHSVLRS